MMCFPFGNFRPAAFFLCAITICPAFPQSGTPAPRPGESAPTAGPASASTAKQANSPEPAPLMIPEGASAETEVVLPQGTPVRLMLTKTISSKTAAVGDRVDFWVLEDVKWADLVVIPRKAVASGRVTAVQHSRARFKPGKILISMEKVTLLDNQIADLSGVAHLEPTNERAKSETAEEIVSVGQLTGGLYLLSAPFYIFSHGPEAVLPAGMVFGSTLVHPVKLELAAVMKAQVAPSPEREGNPVVTIYHAFDLEIESPRVYCGRAKLARLPSGRSLTLNLPPGKYWFRSGDKKETLPLTLEDGKEYYVRLAVIPPLGIHRVTLSAQEHDIGEIEAALSTPLDPKHVKDISKIHSALLTAEPK